MSQAPGELEEEAEAEAREGKEEKEEEAERRRPDPCSLVPGERSPRNLEENGGTKRRVNYELGSSTIRSRFDGDYSDTSFFAK